MSNYQVVTAVPQKAACYPKKGSEFYTVIKDIEKKYEHQKWVQRIEKLRKLNFACSLYGGKNPKKQNSISNCNIQASSLISSLVLEEIAF